MARTIVCFGDSNTHGVDPKSDERLPADVRWPGVVRRELGDGATIIEEGLSGRTMTVDHPCSEGLSGPDYLAPCLRSHKPVDLVVIMLGTNDLKATFRLTPVEVALGAKALVRLARESLTGSGQTPPRVLLVAPVPLGPETDQSVVWGFGAARLASAQLGGLYRVVAKELGVDFLDAGDVASTEGGDGVHLDPAAHRALGTAIATRIRGMLVIG